MTRLARLSVAALVAAAPPCFAQAVSPGSAEAPAPSSGSAIPRSGVIRPGATAVDPGMQVKPPAASGTMNVIHPKVPRPAPDEATPPAPRTTPGH